MGVGNWNDDAGPQMRRDHHLTGDESLAGELAIRRNYLRSIGVTPASPASPQPSFNVETPPRRTSPRPRGAGRPAVRRSHRGSCASSAATDDPDLPHDHLVVGFRGLGSPQLGGSVRPWTDTTAPHERRPGGSRGAGAKPVTSTSPMIGQILKDKRLVKPGQKKARGCG